MEMIYDLLLISRQEITLKFSTMYEQARWENDLNQSDCINNCMAKQRLGASDIQELPLYWQLAQPTDDDLDKDCSHSWQISQE